MKAPMNLFKARGKERAKRIERERLRQAREQLADTIRAKRAKFLGAPIG